jgi:hypothetical protein
MIDLNNAPEQRADGIIPDGTFAKVKMTIRPGGETRPEFPDAIDAKLFRASTTSDVWMLDCEFIVLYGPHSRRKFLQFFTCAGGQVDEKGVSKGWNITYGLLRAMLDSAIGLDPKDESPDAKRKRMLRGVCDFDQIEFVAKIGVEPGKLVDENAPEKGRYPDRNRLAHVVTPDEEEWRIVMGGGEAPAKPSGGGTAQAAASRAAPARQEQQPAWQAQAAPAAAPATPQAVAPAYTVPAAPSWSQPAAQGPVAAPPQSAGAVTQPSQPGLPMGPAPGGVPAGAAPAPVPAGPPWLNG